MFSAKTQGHRPDHGCESWPCTRTIVLVNEGGSRLVVDICGVNRTTMRSLLALLWSMPAGVDVGYRGQFSGVG